MHPSPSSPSCWLGCGCGGGVGTTTLDPELGHACGGWQNVCQAGPACRLAVICEGATPLLRHCILGSLCALTRTVSKRRCRVGIWAQRESLEKRYEFENSQRVGIRKARSVEEAVWGGEERLGGGVVRAEPQESTR